MPPTPRPGLTAARKRAGHSHRSLAAELGVHQSTISRWERGVLSVGERHLRPLAAALNVPLFHLFVLLNEPGLAPAEQAAPGPAAVSRPGAPGENGIVFTGLDGSDGMDAAHPPSLGTPAAGGSLDRLRTGLARMVGAVPTLDDWAQTVHELACVLRFVPPGQFIGDLSAEIADISDTAAGSMPEDARPGLYRTSAGLAALMAAALTEAGELPAASRWWRTARYSARAAGDLRLQAWLHGGQAVLCQAVGLTGPALRQVAKARELAAGEPCAGLAEALAAEAETLAARGDAEAANRALAELDEVFQRLPPVIRGEHGAVWGWPVRRLRRTRTSVRASLGERGVGDELQVELGELEPEAVRDRAKVILKMSLVLLQAGRFEEGLTKAVAALAALPAAHRTTTVMHLARRVHWAVPEHARDSAIARNLRVMLLHVPSGTSLPGPVEASSRQVGSVSVLPGG